MTVTKPADAVDGRKKTNRHAKQVSTLSQAQRVRLGLGVLTFAAVTVMTYRISRYWIFTGFSIYDDEGYMLMSLKSFLSNGWRYDGFNGYGPFYYEFWGAVFSVFGISVNHDDGRTVTMVVWALSSLLIALSIWRMTGSIVLGLLTQLTVFEALSSLILEPMHAGGIIVLLLSAIMAFSCGVRGRTAPFSAALLGGAVMALILVKTNIGVFALAAVVLVCVVSYPALSRRRWLRPAVEVGFVALPLLLIAARLSEAWARHYAFHVSAAALAVVIALRARRVARRDAKELWWVGGGLLAVGIAVLLAMLATGTSPAEPIEVIKFQLHFASLFSFPLALPNWTYILDLLALAGALGYWYVARDHEARPSLTWSWLVSALSTLVGIFMLFSVIGSMTGPRALLDLVCLTWVALIQPPGKPDEKTQFARLLLPPLAVLQALHAFPVAGSQLSWGTLLLIPAGALCIANGVRWIAFSFRGHSARRATLMVGEVAAIAGLVIVSSTQLTQRFEQVTQLQRRYEQVRTAYDGMASLELPGAEVVHVQPQIAANYQAIVAAIDENCNSFVMLPGMNSFYLWTQQEPPAGSTWVETTAILDDARQQKMIEAISSIDGLCLLENARQAQAGTTFVPSKPPPGPLVRYLHRGFTPIANFGQYQLLKREGSGS